MKFGIMFANVGPYVEPDGAVGIARIAEEHGFDSLWTVEHTVVPDGYESQYPYSPDGRMPGGDDAPIPDPLMWLAWVGAATTTIRLATGILILPQRNPITLAKELATLDRLSGGRVELGVGVGWLEEVFEALGVPFAGRGRRMDEYIEVMRVLWRDGGAASFHGESVNFDECHSNPKPVQPGGIPIVVGGHTEAAARRAGRLGDGFFPGRSTVEELTGLLEVMRASAVECGRDPHAIEVTAGGAFDLDGAQQFADLGVHRIVLPPLAWNLEKLRSRLGAFSESVIEKVG
jgi:probable F420-dependent oxidoreductase